MITTTNDSQISLLYKILKNKVEITKTILKVIILVIIKIIIIMCTFNPATTKRYSKKKSINKFIPKSMEFQIKVKINAVLYESSHPFLCTNHFTSIVPTNKNTKKNIMSINIELKFIYLSLTNYIDLPLEFSNFTYLFENIPNVI